ncbi:MAG TPA: baseplate J/gp47 family protein [Ktedonobacteraceae bacterium]|nr:baseplate J/gp47 family protein [Ktedonobacteraceae bacterium]
MADEQIIYLSPDEDLTSTRERLEQVQARKIILVIPPQTSLRSHVGWRVLHARARELGQEVLVISSDRQIRAVAKAVGFRVAESQESPSPNKSRPARRPQGTPIQRGGRTQRQNESTSTNRPMRSGFAGRPGDLEGRAVRRDIAGRPQGSPIQGPQATRRAGQPGQEPGRQILSETERQPQVPEPRAQSTFQEPADTTGSIIPPGPAAPLLPADMPPDQQQHFHIETSPSVSPRLPQHDEDELPDSLIDHYNQAQSIRKQFLGSNLTSSRSADLEAPAPLSKKQELEADQEEYNRPGTGTSSYQQGPAIPLPSWSTRDEAGLLNKQPVFGQEDTDVYEYYLEDVAPSSLPEQRGSAFIEEVDTGIPDLSDRPTDILEGEIEDLGDEGAILVQPETFVPEWNEPVEDEMEQPPSTRGFGSRFQTGRADIDDAEMLPPVTERPTQVRQQPAPAPAPVRRSGSLPAPAAGSSSGALRNRGKQPAIPTQKQTGNGQPDGSAAPVKQAPDRERAVASPQAPVPARAVKASKQPGGSAPKQGWRKPVTPGQPRKPAAQSRNDRKVFAGFLIVVACLLILFALFYFLPSARVTIAVPARPLTISALHFSASTNSHNAAANTVASQVLSFEKSATGNGTATGTSQVGNARATGQVIFTNHGSQQVEIPTGTILATSSGVKFATTADAVIFPPGGGSNPPIPVQAVNAGTSGNVAAGSITVIPQISLTAIAQYNNVSTSALSLDVTNPQALAGGGAMAATTVTSKDISAEKAALEKQLKTNLQSWLAQQLHTGDISGTPAQQSEQVTTNPTVGQITKDGTFSMTVTVHTMVLVVRAAALQAAAAKQVNVRAMQMQPAYMLVTGEQLKLSKIKSSPSKDGSSIAITLDATGQIIQRISTNDIRAALAGKSIGQANSDIKNGLAGLHGVLRTSIVESPGFLPMLPFRSDNITVILLPVATTTPTPGVPNG